MEGREMETRLHDKADEFLEEVKLKLQSRLWKLMAEGIEPDDICRRIGKPAWYIWEHLLPHRSTRLRTLHDLARAMDCRMEVHFVANEDV